MMWGFGGGDLAVCDGIYRVGRVRGGCWSWLGTEFVLS